MNTTTTNGSTETTTQTTSTALARAPSTAIEPRDMGELQVLAVAAAKSNFFGAKTPEQALMLMMSGRDLGFSYTQALRMMHVIKDKPSLSADGAVAVCLAHPELCEYFRPVEETDTTCTWETKRRDNPPRRETFTIEDAQRADLTKQNGDMYRKYPKRMLSARAKMFLARDVYPELLGGLYDPDEVREATQARPAYVASAPVMVDDSQTTSLAEDLSRLLAEAGDAAALEHASRAISEANLTKADKARLRVDYKAAKERVETAAKLASEA